MARSIWNGTITFGLTAVPIKVHSSTEDRTIHFHQVHVEDGARVKQKRICSKDGKAVPSKQVAKGYEVREGAYVMLSQEEIDAASGSRSHLIELEEFVRAPEIDPVFYDRTYYLGARKGGQAAYRLLRDALERSERVGIGRWVFHNREYVVAIRPLERVLALHTMRFADELVDAGSLDLPSPSRAPSQREIAMASSLVDSLHDRFDPGAFADGYRERVLALIGAKARGEEPELPDEPEAPQAPDLMAALEASLETSTPSKPTSTTRTKGKTKTKAKTKGKGKGKGKAKRWTKADR
jgi:DNA end-binding protein Ku